MSERWKEIEVTINYGKKRGIYTLPFLVSDRGKVKAPHRHLGFWRGETWVEYERGEQELKEFIANGYVKTSAGFTHQLVAKAFVENPNPKVLIEVNHIDGNKLNNHWTNLEWVTHSENLQKYYNSTLASKRGDVHGVKVKKGKESWKFRSQKEAAEFIGCHPSLITLYFQNNFKQCKGYELEKDNRKRVGKDKETK